MRWKNYHERLEGVIWKKVVVARFEVLTQNWPRETDEDHFKHQP